MQYSSDWGADGGRPINPDLAEAACHGCNQNPAIDCGIDPNDGLLVAYLPKLDTVLQEHYQGDETLVSIDGMVLDLKAPKPVKWWRVRRAAGDAGMAVVEPVWQGRAGDFSLQEGAVFASFFSPDSFHEHEKLYMRAYSRGPWICLERTQLEQIYGKLGAM